MVLEIDCEVILSTNWMGLSSRTREESEYNEFEPPLKFAKTQFQLSAGLNLSVEPTIFKPRLKFKPRL